MLPGDIQKMSSVLTFNMCLACVCVRPCCVGVIWYLLKRMFPFYVELAQKKKAKTWSNAVHMQKKSWLLGRSEERKQGGEYMKNLFSPLFSLLLLLFLFPSRCGYNRLLSHPKDQKNEESVGTLLLFKVCLIKVAERGPKNFPAWRIRRVALLSI